MPVLDIVKRIEGKILSENTSTFCYNKPGSIQIETTTECNLSCLWCFRHKRKPLKDMHLSVFKLLMEDIGQVKEVYPFGGGEPLIHRDFDKIISAASESAGFVGISTNATLLDRVNTEKLNASGLKELTISLDSPNEKDFAYIRKGSNLKKVLSNVEYFSLHSEIKIRIHAVLSKINVVSASMLPELAEKLGANKLTLNILHPTTYKHLDLMPKPEVTEKRLDIIRRKSNLLKLESNAKQLLENPPETTICKAPLFSCFIDSEGNMAPCCNYPMLQLSNVFRNGFKSCWNNREIRRFRKEVLTGFLYKWCILYCHTPRLVLRSIHNLHKERRLKP